MITSLDVVVHYDRVLGEGGFTTVYEGLWKGTKVAVKVMNLDKGVTSSVGCLLPTASTGADSEFYKPHTGYPT